MTVGEEITNLPKFDFDMAHEFLNALDSCADGFSFQTFYDSKKPKESDFKNFEDFNKSLAQYSVAQRKCSRILHGSFKDHLAELTRLQKMGAGVYVTINKTDLRGRRESNIIAIRAQFTDADDSNSVPFDLTASLMLESARGQHNYYFLHEGEPKELFSGVQRELSYYLKTDSQINDLPRVMRLPGFYHLKDLNNPRLVRIKEITNKRYHCWEIISKLGEQFGGYK
ncbi:MAG: hypothetical protein K2Q26_12435 [Bdellovibrionales bacterium]|nr:hypothetical protein [Bdellovibrionales bacterium]